MTDNKLLTRTSDALGPELMSELQRLHFCVVGCGGTGALFAEMLVRSGAEKITLIDGDTVDKSNLNRCVSFVCEDVDQLKVNVLKSRLQGVNSDCEIEPISCHLREQDRSDAEGQKARDAFYNSDVVVISVDKNSDRIICESLCCDKDIDKKSVISVGVRITATGCAEYECTWKPKTPQKKREDEGYGLGSYAAIVIEATSVAFSMLLHHLKNPDSSDFKCFSKSYKNFVPQENCCSQSP